jgi:phosphoglucomutase
VLFADGSRIVYRLSGTGSAGATIRVYLEQYSDRPEQIHLAPPDVIPTIIQLALQLGKIEEFTGCREPSVIT